MTRDPEDGQGRDRPDERGMVRKGIRRTSRHDDRDTDRTGNRRTSRHDDAEPIRPEIGTFPTRDPRLRRIELLSWFLDNAILVPGTNLRIGYDALIGLIPGAGDLISAGLSTYILFEAAQLGVSRATLSRMAVNVVLDAIVGAVPVAGDLFDAAWKANARNVELIHGELGTRPRRGPSNRRFFVVLALIVLGVLVLGIGSGVVLAVLVVRALGG